MADENLKINLDAPGGVRMSKDPVTQLEVYMYYAKPGEYLTPLGGPVPEEIAARAGYDVELFGKQKVRAEKLTEFQNMLDLEMSLEGDGTVLEERGGYQLVEVGTLGHVKVLDTDGNAVVNMPYPRELGETLFNKLAGPAPVMPLKGKAKSLED